MWEIKSKLNIVKATVNSLEYNGEWMGECYVNVSIESPTPIDFEIGDYLMYRGERFEINYDPGKIKSAPPYKKGDAFKYENIKFNSLADELTRCDFLDVVLEDNQLHFTGLPKFSFYGGVQDLANRMQANLDRAYGKNTWQVIVSPEYKGTKELNVSVDNIKVQGALSILVNDFETYFTQKGRTITIGAAGIPAGHLFKYGKGNGLYEIEQNAEADQAIVTRVRAYGSTRNLPHRFYNNIGAKISLRVISKFTWIAPGTSGIQLGTLHVTLESHGKLKDRDDIKISINGKEYNATYEPLIGNNPNFFRIRQIYEVDAKAIIPGQTKVYVIEGASLADFEQQYIDYSGIILPNNYAVTNLMLPGFPEKSLRELEKDASLKPLRSNNKQDPYVDSPNIAKLGIREGTIFFDGSGDLPEIYPSIEGMTAEQLKAAGVSCNSTGELDVIVSAEQITDNGVGEIKGDNSELAEADAYFKVTLKDLTFDINDYIIEGNTETPSLSFKSGKLGGREFEIFSCKPVKNGSGAVTGYELELKRVFDDGIKLWFPYKDYNAAAGDKVVILHIALPPVYIKAASQDMLEKTKEWLSKNDYSRSIYAPKIDELFMARQHDEAMASNGTIASLHDTLRAGMVLLFEDEDFNIDAAIPIDRLTIKEGDGPIPTYEVVLKEEKTVGRLDKMQNQIDSLASGKGQGGIGGYTAAQIRQMIDAYGVTRFLSKLYPDTATGLKRLLDGIEVGDYATGIKGARVTTAGDGEVESLKVRKGASVGTDLAVGRKVTVGNYVPGVSGGVFYIDENGEAHIETGQMTVNGKLRVKEIEVQQQTWAGGAQVLSPAGMVCEKVEPRVDGQGAVNGWKCLFRTQAPDGRKVWNQFRVGDLARCETFNLVDDDGYLTNRYYWRMVTEVGYETDAEGTQWGYVLLSNVEGNYDPKSVGAGSVPLPGDSIVTMGVAGSLGDGNDDRRSLVILSSCGEGSPYIYQFKGINSFSLPASKLKTRISPGGNLFTGRFLVEAGGRDPEDITDIIDRQKPYSLRPSVRSVLVFHHEDADTGETFPSFSPAAFTCGLFKSSGTGETTKVGWGSLPPGMEVRATVRRHDAEAGASVDDPAYAYHGEVIYPEEDMRSVTFSLLIDGHTADEAAVSVQTDATGLASEYRASLEVTEKAITQQVEKTNDLESLYASLKVTADEISSKVGRTSANLIKWRSPMWDNPSQDLGVTNVQSEGGFDAEQEYELTQEWQTFRCPMDTSRFKPSTDYVLSLDIMFQDDEWEQVISGNRMAFRAGVCDAPQRTFLLPWATPLQKGVDEIYYPKVEYDPGYMESIIFRFKTPAVLPTGPMFLSLILRWDQQAQQEGPLVLSTRLMKLEEGTVPTAWVPADKDLESIMEQQADQIALSVKVDGKERAGLTLDAEGGITLAADKVRIKNGDQTAALFIGGILNAALIVVSKLMTVGKDGSTRVTIGEFDDPFIRFYHEDGVTVAMKLGLDYVSLEEKPTITPNLSPASDEADEDTGETAKAAVSGESSAIPIFKKGKECVMQVFDATGKLTWVMFTTGPQTPDTQTYSWRVLSLVPPGSVTEAQAKTTLDFKAQEYWQFKVNGDNAVAPYKNYKDKVFIKKLSDANFSSPAAYLANGRFYFPTAEMKPATVGGADPGWRRGYYDITAGTLSSIRYLDVTP